MEKQMGVSFAIPHKSIILEKVPKITMQSRSVRDNDKTSSEPGSSTFIVATHGTFTITKPPQCYSTTLNYVLLTKFGKLWNYS